MNREYPKSVSNLTELKLGGEDEMETDAWYGTQIFIKCISLYYAPVMPNYDYFVQTQYADFHCSSSKGF